MHPNNSTGRLASHCSRKKVVITDETQKAYPRRGSRLVQRADVMIADAIAPDWFRIIKHMDDDEAFELIKQLKKETCVLFYLGHSYAPFDMSRYPLSCGNVIIEL